jgi:small-conductance mechanosensitive channel
MAKRLQVGLLAGLLVLLAAAGVGIWMTGGSQPKVLNFGRKPAPAPRAEEVVDQSPLETAERLAADAEGQQEQQLAAEAQRLADHEVDLAFEQALRTAAEEQASLTGEALALRKELDARLQQLAADDQKIAKLKQAAVAGGANANADELQKQIALAEAERALDEDQAEDAREDLARAGGDPRARIQQLLDQHNAAQHDQQASAKPAGDAGGGNSLISQIERYRRVAAFRDRVAAAQQATQTLMQSLGVAHQDLAQETNQERAQNSQHLHDGKRAKSQPKSPPATAPGAEAGISLALLHHLQNDQKNLTAYDKRTQDVSALSDIYGKWLLLVDARRAAALHSILISLAIILAIVLAGVLLHLGLEGSFKKIALDHRSMHTFRAVLRLAVQVLCVIAILVVIFGPPTQTGTMLGLLGAGLTVVLKDFIVSFFGWFVLMGRNGIRVGDWVEIESIRGEVVEIGLLRTVLLETGNWTDQGRPTGRKVSFANMYAMEQHYFNFSTASQWLWDELEVLIPYSQDPNPLVESIREIVAAETAENQKLAAEEWQRVRRDQAGPPISTAAHISLRPVREGVDLKVRYVARAPERYELRSKLYSRILDLLRQSRAGQMSAGTHGA